jgi:hypothetical protein
VYFSKSAAEMKQTISGREEYHYLPEELVHLWHKNLRILFVTDGTWRIHYYTPSFHGSVAGTEDVLVTPFTCDRTGSGDAIIAGTEPPLLIRFPLPSLFSFSQLFHGFNWMLLVNRNDLNEFGRNKKRFI